MLAEVIAQSRFVQKIAGIVGLTGTQLGSLRVAQTEAEGDEMTRAGLRYHASGLGASGVAPVQALPSTACQWLIYNPLSNPVTAFFDRLGMIVLSGTAGAGGAVLACIVPPKFMPSTIPTASAANMVIQNANAVSSKSSSLVITSAQTLQNAGAGNWFPIGQMNPNGTVLGQTYLDQTFDIKGRIAAPPGCGIGLCVISPTGTTPLYVPFASWREYTSDVE